MILIGQYDSAFVRRVAIALRLYGLPFEHRPWSTFAEGDRIASDWSMQRLADLLDAPVDRPMIQETTALGAAYLAGLAAGVYPEPAKFATTGGWSIASSRR